MKAIKFRSPPCSFPQIPYHTLKSWVRVRSSNLESLTHHSHLNSRIFWWKTFTCRWSWKRVFQDFPDGQILQWYLILNKWRFLMCTVISPLLLNLLPHTSQNLLKILHKYVGFNVMINFVIRKKKSSVLIFLTRFSLNVETQLREHSNERENQIYSIWTFAKIFFINGTNIPQVPEFYEFSRV